MAQKHQTDTLSRALDSSRQTLDMLQAARDQPTGSPYLLAWFEDFFEDIQESYFRIQELAEQAELLQLETETESERTSVPQAIFEDLRQCVRSLEEVIRRLSSAREQQSVRLATINRISEIVRQMMYCLEQSREFTEKDDLDLTHTKVLAESELPFRDSPPASRVAAAPEMSAMESAPPFPASMIETEPARSSVMQVGDLPPPSQAAEKLINEDSNPNGMVDNLVDCAGSEDAILNGLSLHPPEYICHLLQDEASSAYEAFEDFLFTIEVFALNAASYLERFERAVLVKKATIDDLYAHLQDDIATLRNDFTALGQQTGMPSELETIADEVLDVATDIMAATRQHTASSEYCQVAHHLASWTRDVLAELPESDGQQQALEDMMAKLASFDPVVHYTEH